MVSPDSREVPFIVIGTGFIPVRLLCKMSSFKINDEEVNRYFPILMDGHYDIYEGSKVYNWILGMENLVL